MLYICRSCTNGDLCRENMGMCLNGAGYSPKEITASREPAEPFVTFATVSGYESLSGVLKSALDQAQHGKGKERHANGKPFEQQPIMEIGRMVGVGYMTGQAMKKTAESTRLPTLEMKEKELLGAINYLAAAILLERENAQHDAN